MNRRVLLLGCAISLLLCVPSRSIGARVEPIYEAVIRVPATATMDDIAKAIKHALIERS